MFKKMLLAASCVAMFYVSNAVAGTADSESKRTDISGNFGSGSLRNTYVNRVSSSGHIVNEQDGVGHLGSPSYRWGRLYLADNGIITSTGVTNHHETFLDLAGATTGAILNQTIGQLTLGGLVTNSTTYVVGDLTQPVVPRNIIIFASVSVNGVTQTSANLTATAYISGLDSMGRSTSAYQTVVTTSYASVGLGNVAWAQISSVTIVATSSNSVNIAGNVVNIRIGTSNKIGLANKISSADDVYHVVEAGTPTTTYTVDSTYNTIDFVTDGTAANDYDVWYKQRYFTSLP